MRSFKTVLFALIILGVITVMLYYAGEKLQSLGKVVRIANSIAPKTADAEPPPPADAKPPTPVEEPADPKPKITDDTQAKLARITTGMTRDEVEAILGQCLFAKTEYAEDGAAIRTALWIRDTDTVGARFRNGAVTKVIGRRLAALAEEPAPAAPAKAASTTKPAPVARQPIAPITPVETLRRWHELDEQIRNRTNPEELLLRLFGERDAK